jgi:hypothetical protein
MCGRLLANHYDDAEPCKSWYGAGGKGSQSMLAVGGIEEPRWVMFMSTSKWPERIVTPVVVCGVIGPSLANTRHFRRGLESLDQRLVGL